MSEFDTPHENEDYHQNQFMVAIARNLGLNPAHITNLEAMADGEDAEYVTVRWEGIDRIPMQTWMEMYEQHKDSIVAVGAKE